MHIDADPELLGRTTDPRRAIRELIYDNMTQGACRRYLKELERRRAAREPLIQAYGRPRI